MGFFDGFLKDDSRILFFQRCESTNDIAKKIIDGYESGTIITCDMQTGGRGRSGKKWKSSSSGNIYMSVIYKNDYIRKDTIPLLSQVAGLALYNYLKQYIEEAEIILKWPNDILVNEKKICGILVETSYIGERPDGIVVGVGFNLNTDVEYFTEEKFNGTSLLVETDKYYRKNEFMIELADIIIKYLDLWNQYGFDYFYGQWSKIVRITDRKCLFYKEHELKTGVVKDVVPGNFIVEYENEDIFIPFESIEIPEQS